MTSISIAALKGKTIKEIMELIKQAESLPENHSPQTDKVRTHSEEQMSASGMCPSGSPVDTKNQTAQELLEEIENE